MDLRKKKKYEVPVDKSSYYHPRRVFSLLLLRSNQQQK
jgi:hypothetical protein